jgi:hypothetical protein
MGAVASIDGYDSDMSSLPEIEKAIQQLAPDQLTAFRAWFADFDAEQWDRQIEQDVKAGRIDALAAEALADLREGRTTDL